MSAPPTSAVGASRSPSTAAASAVAVSGSSRVTIEATAAGTARTPVKNSPYASAVGTSPRYTSSASPSGSAVRSSPAVSATGVSSTAPTVKPTVVVGTPAGAPADSSTTAA
ncbi:hypothetical protein IN07_15125 [Modestobacter caceresii]|uniref:Uncharacterized protein n=1 Tax=Modestobacter caceresii TaxID=1522368 RepID=A0A098Y5W4_9ACTN|nr:hypothetical protein IN07_15125 [Modestobacter caceresii]